MAGALVMSLLLAWLAGRCEALECNYCYQADLMADCRLNSVQCEPEFVCSVETSVITYTEAGGEKEKIYLVYKMGCEHYSMCRDAVSRGTSPYGYSTVRRFCCCSARCEAPDGVGQRDSSNASCPVTWGNYTTGTGVKGSVPAAWTIVSVAVMCYMSG